jgi:uncharacterized protein (TIGR00725 family)
VRRPVIGVVGAGEPSNASLAAARELGRLLAERGWVVLTGGRPAGVMAAAASGAKQVPGSLTLGILPGVAGGESPDLDIAVFTGMGDGRNVINVLTSDVIVACGIEGPGTSSEVALALKAGKPVILLGTSALARSFFASIRGRALLLEAAAPGDVVRVIEGELGISRGRWD